MPSKLKEDKQKVTLYLTQELHRQMKIKAAVDSETMTDIAQKAIVFYLTHPDLVEQGDESYGHSHRVYSCPECSSQVVLHEGNMVSLQGKPGVMVEEGLSVEKPQPVGVESQGEGKLVPC